MAIALFMGVLLIDLWGISTRYVHTDAFVPKRIHSRPFVMTPADKAILQDTTRFRVFEPRLGLTGSRTAFFHNAIGGYHGAKPRRFEELYNYYYTHEIRSILNMLNVKYLLYEGEEGGVKPLQNPEALGNVWLVDSLHLVANADRALEALKNLDLRHQAVVESGDLADTIPHTFKRDSLATIRLAYASPDKLEYEFTATEDQFAVFSEMYYPKGWTMTINGSPSEICRVNYVLRGVFIPKGSHSIVLSFTPSFLETGTLVRWSSLGIFAILVAGMWWRERKNP